MLLHFIISTCLDGVCRRRQNRVSGYSTTDSTPIDASRSLFLQAKDTSKGALLNGLRTFVSICLERIMQFVKNDENIDSLAAKMRETVNGLTSRSILKQLIPPGQIYFAKSSFGWWSSNLLALSRPACILHQKRRKMQRPPKFENKQKIKSSQHLHADYSFGSKIL